MALAAGTRLGVYEIVDALGAGGMGEVYRARDTTLGRSVAIKILPDAVRADADRLARFEREARALAALNHPHIAHVYGYEAVARPPSAVAMHVLVMELAEGGTLADRLARGPLPIDEGLAIARQIAQALEAAHDRGIVHRDLKPANIGLTGDGRVKVLDFGLAKGVDAPAAVQEDPSSSPTITSPVKLTGVGVLLGTAAYMAPEQAKGRAADKRSDVWAFGCVLYELFAGRRAFAGRDVASTLAAILTSEPDWKALPASLPPAVNALIRGCLERDRDERVGDMAAARFALTLREPALTISPAPPARRIASRAAASAAIVVVGIAVAIAARALRTAPPQPVSRFAIALPEGETLTTIRQAVALSPDGRQLAYSANGRLYIRSFGDFEARLVSGLDPVSGAVNPVFSPDGLSLAFWADSAIKRVSTSGGTASIVCEAVPAPMDIQWTADSIVFSQPAVGIFRVSPGGGTPSVLVPVRSGEQPVHSANLLPDGRSLLLTVAAGTVTDPFARTRIVVQSFDGRDRRTLIENADDARYVPTGHVVYAAGGTLFAVAFDAARREVRSTPVPVVEGVRRAIGATAGVSQYHFSSAGSLVYVPGPPSVGQQDVILFDRHARAEPLGLPPGSYQFPRISPDGRRVAFESADNRNAYIAVYDLSGRESAQRVTFGGNNRFPVWSADNRRVAFQSDREGDAGIFTQPVDGGAAQRLTKAEGGASHIPESWSPSGDTLLFSTIKEAHSSLWMLSVGDGRVARFGDVRGSGVPADAVFSPDGHWVAYQMSEVTDAEGITYVEPFPPTGAKYQIGRGGRAVWSRDGRELLRVPAPGRLLSVTVKMQPTFSFSAPTLVPRAFGIAEPSLPRPYDLTADGRIIGVGPAGQGTVAAPTQIDVVLNWFDELTRKVPAK